MQTTPIQAATLETIAHVHNPAPEFFGEDFLDWLKSLQGPTWITLDGKDTSRQRAVVTMLHGNEPSGLRALHEMLSQGIKPATNLGIFVASVSAALYPPMLSHRYLPHEVDFNRCFGKAGTTNQERLANRLVDTLRDFSPEAVIDTHNTSAHSDPFAVVTVDSTEIRQLTDLFTRKLVVLDQRMGTLIEQSLGCPIVTIEFGGFMDPRADEIAEESLRNFITYQHLFDTEPGPLQILRHPLRLEIVGHSGLHYSSSVQEDPGPTIFNTIDQMNFKRLKQGTSLGWLEADGIDPFRVINPEGKNICSEFFVEHLGFLDTRVPLTIFMATTDAFIAKKDCLLYLVPDHP